MKVCKKISIVFLFVLSLVFSACGSQKAKKETLALLVGEADAFRTAYRDAVISLAEKAGVELITYAANDDAAIQTDQLKTLLNQGVRNFIILPVNTDVTLQFANLVNSFDGCIAFSNIPPKSSALRVNEKFFYASSLETSSGFFQAKILDSYFSKNPDKLEDKTMNVVMFYGAYSHSAQKYRLKGVTDGLKSLGYKINVLAADSANWSRANARQMMEIWYGRYGDSIDAVIAQNDEMALGVVEALVSEGYDSSSLASILPVVGIDAEDEAVQAVHSGAMLGTVKQDVDMQARTSFELVMKCSKDGRLSSFTTRDGISAASQTENEPPVEDSSVLSQCYVVPFVPVTGN